MRRLAPRELSSPLPAILDDIEPPTALARIQRVWAAVVGADLAKRAFPVTERDGVVTVVCESSMWAQELELLAPEFLPGLRERVGRPLERLAFRVGSVPK